MDTSNIQSTKIEHTVDISLNEDMQSLAPLLESNTPCISIGAPIMGDGSPFAKPLGDMDLDIPQFKESPINSILNSHDSMDYGEVEELQNQATELPDPDNLDNIWLNIQKGLGDGDLEEDDSEYQRAKAAFEAEINPSLESQIRFEKAQEKEHLRISRVRLREALSQSESNIPQDHNHGKDTEEPGILEAEEIKIQNLGHGETFDLFCSDNEEVPIQDLANYSTPDNEVTLPVFTKRDATNSRKVAKSKGGTQNASSKKGRKAPNDKVKKAKQKGGNTRVQKSKSSSKPKKRGSKNKEPTRLNFDSLFTSNLLENAKRNAKKEAIPTFTSGDKRKALKEIMGNIPTDEDIDMRSMSEHKRAIMGAILKFTKKPRPDHAGGWKHLNLKTSLFHYQLLGVAFMRDRENASAAPKGGFLCDEMGFGKTIQAIANMVDGKVLLDSREPTITLIVAPTHLMLHWKEELIKHVKPGVLGHIFTYHGAGKSDLDFSIQSGGTKNIGVIITTYGEIRSSCNFPVPDFLNKDDLKAWKLANCGLLHNLYFRRIYLDEAHEIKNHASKTSQAVRLLSAKFRWVITGTPIHNYVQEFYPYFHFLRVPGLENYHFFQDKIVQNDSNHRRLVNCLRAYMLRRTHAETLFGRPILKLPDIDENTIVVKFSIVERALYRKVIGGFLDRNLHTMRTVEGISNYLTLLLILRMFTSHLLLPHSTIRQILTPQFMLEMQPAVEKGTQREDIEMYNSLQTMFEGPISSSESPAEALPQANLRTLFKSAANSPNAGADVVDCIVCKKGPKQVFILSCMHVCCCNCLPKLARAVGEQYICFCGSIVQQYDLCVDIQRLCRSKAGPKERGTRSRDNARPEDYNEDEGIHWASSANHIVPSTKLKAVRSIVSKWLEDSPGTKITIFTQFIGMMHILCSLCEAEGWEYTTISGKLSHATRHANIKRFREEGNINILISSLKTGGVGLDLTMATKCILVDLWWNEAIEQQAFCRLFRIGQKKDVEIIRICVDNTVDDRIQLLQSVKSAHIEEAMGSKVFAQRDSISDILALFSVEEDENSDKGYRFLPDEETPELVKEISSNA